MTVEPAQATSCSSRWRARIKSPRSRAASCSLEPKQTEQKSYPMLTGQPPVPFLLSRQEAECFVRLACRSLREDPFPLLVTSSCFHLLPQGSDFGSPWQSARGTCASLPAQGTNIPYSLEKRPRNLVQTKNRVDRARSLLLACSAAWMRAQMLIYLIFIAMLLEPTR